MEYMTRDFNFEHITEAKLGDSMHFHSYRFHKGSGSKLVLDSRYSTDRRGIEKLLGLNASANVEFEEIARMLESKISDSTIFRILLEV